MRRTSSVVLQVSTMKPVHFFDGDLCQAGERSPCQCGMLIMIKEGFLASVFAGPSRIPRTATDSRNKRSIHSIKRQLTESTFRCTFTNLEERYKRRHNVLLRRRLPFGLWTLGICPGLP